MNLYLISQTVNNDYDTYDSAIVAAEDKNAARLIHPGGDWNRVFVWCESPDDVEVKLIGKALEGQQSGVILASFNAG